MTRTFGFTDRSGFDDPRAADAHPAAPEPPFVFVGRVKERREKAVLVADYLTPEITVWLPLAAIRLDDTGFGQVRVTLPLKLALDKGLVTRGAAGQGEFW